jgi:Zn-dependent M28 family amino/carboxypeptidase
MNRIILFALLIALSTQSLLSEKDEKWNKIFSSAYFENTSYNFLGDICDLAGGRIVGTEANKKALNILKTGLKSMDITPKEEFYKIPGWIRNEDEVTILEPLQKKLRAFALGYVDKTPEFTAEVVNCQVGTENDFKKIDAKGKIALVSIENPNREEIPLRYEVIENAYKNGALAVLFTNDKEGTLVLCGTSNFQGNKSKLPAFTISLEEGKILSRLLAKGEKPKVRIKTLSEWREVETSNIIATFPGTSPKKIVIGAHFDSWDLGQGAIDNGNGTAVLYDLASLIKKIFPNNYYTIELVWFNGEELGLWGSKKYMEMHKNDDIIYMINMDMIGTPTGFNLMGIDKYIPFFEKIAKNLNGYNMKGGVTSQPWTNSDHMYFIFEGIPTLTFSGFLEKNMYWHYHDAGDTFDKADKKILSDAAAIVGITIYELANNKELEFIRLSKSETASMLKKFNLDKRLKRQGEWIFGD